MAFSSCYRFGKPTGSPDAALFAVCSERDIGGMGILRSRQGAHFDMKLE
jgi:hypothetical protein